MRTVHTVIAPYIFAILLLVGLNAPAAAQVEPIDPVWMVATREAPLRCGELSTFYKVADLKPGQLVRVDGRSTRWARVIYPEDLYGFVQHQNARDVISDESGPRSLTVGEISDIKAPNQISGLTGSWRSIYLGELAAGTRLEIVGEALAKDGQMVGYKVRPPVPPAVDHPPHAFVQIAALRDATQEEIDAHRAALERKKNQEEAGGDEDAASPDTMSDDNPAQPKPIRNPENSETGISSESESAAETDAGTQSTEAEPSEQASDEVDPEPQTDESLVEEMMIPTQEDLSEPEPATDDGSETTGERADEAASEAENAPGREPTAEPVAPARRDYLLWEELEQTLTRVRRAGGKTLEDSLDELIAEYQRSLTNTQTASVRQALGTRLDWLRLRKSARDQRLALQAALQDAKDFRSDVQREREAWRSARGYDIVGRLVPSAIYDGQTLPKMYRIVAAGEGGLTRTIGYVQDQPGMNLDALVGEVVGVAGDAKLDDALRLRVITPRAIDRFRPAAVQP